MCGVTMVVAHQSVDEPSNCFAVPPITVTVVCVCGKSGVEVAMVAMPHTHHDACDEPPIPTTHSSVCECADGGHGSGGCVGDGNGM